MALNKQYCVYGIDTGAFYFENELEIEKDLYKFREQKKRYKAELETCTDKYLSGLIETKLSYINKRIRGTKECLVDMMNVNKKKTRFLIPAKLTDKKRISLFDGELTRCFDLVPINYDVKMTTENTVVNEEIMVVSVFYFEVLESLICNGYDHNGFHYVYFASSAGQIRTKRGLFVREDLLNKHWNTLACGLTIDKINAKGGMNLNKFNAYLALCNSATDLWEDFDIDRCIVVDDFETSVIGEVDYINDADYSITRQTMPVPIPHTDGCGMILPELSTKNFMVRLPFIKGLLGVFDFKRFVKEKGCSPVIKDIWGKNWHILEDNIQIIFTKSQLKMYAYYDSWQEYKSNFKKYGCHAGKCKVEDDRFKKATINYQMVSSFISYNDNELSLMCRDSVNFINGICSDKGKQLETFGVSEFKNPNNYNGLQKCLSVYADLLRDSYCREQLKSFREKLIKDLYSAKFKVNGYYTFLLPDLYAFSEWLFMGVEIPNGLLKTKEVHCKLHKFDREVDCLRSPHLYQEHSIQKNVTNDEIEKWFTTNACYTSTHDMISKELQFDVDGDFTLIVQNKNIITVAKRNQKNIVPLYYNMRKANKEILTSESRYAGLSVAFTGGNIGLISNNIAKIKNSPEISNPDTVKEAMDCLRWNCMINNEVIDFAKCLYKSTPPKEVSEIIRKYVNRKLPHFFIYAKDKSEDQVEPLTDCIVDRIFTLYPKEGFKLEFETESKFDHTVLMHNPKQKCDEDVLRTYSDCVSNLKLKKSDDVNNNILTSDIMAEMSKLPYSQIEICDMLVSDMFNEHNVFKNDRRKEFLFAVYGDMICDNIIHNKKKSKNRFCVDCGSKLKARSKLQIRCPYCQKKHVVEYHQQVMADRRNVC